jgi:signal transduction histidine kinase
LAELRRLLGVLRPEADQHESLTPQPGLADLATLTEHLREAGLSVTLVKNGNPRELPAGLDLAAYRVVQEALTNVLKHADVMTADVQIDYGTEVLDLKVNNNGTGDPETRGQPGAGHGLIGMRERVTAYGGELDAGPDTRGGYTVRVRLPMPAT